MNAATNTESGIFLVMVYGSWGCEVHDVADTIDAAKEVARAASERRPHNEYCVEIEPGGFENPLFKAGKQIGGK